MLPWRWAVEVGDGDEPVHLVVRDQALTAAHDDLHWGPEGGEPDGLAFHLSREDARTLASALIRAADYSGP